MIQLYYFVISLNFNQLFIIIIIKLNYFTIIHYKNTNTIIKKLITM